MRRRVGVAWAPVLILIWTLFALGCGGAAKGPGAAPFVEIKPAITAQPQSQTVWTPAEATFVVQASGSNLAYQWHRNGSDIPGAVSNIYKTGATNVNDHDSKFSVTVSNAVGSDTSATATLTANERPTLLQDLTDLSVQEGQSASFHVTAQGTPVLRYQWMRGGVVIQGAASATYALSPAVRTDDGAVFKVVVSNTLDSSAYSVTSRSATLRVGSVASVPTITQQPTNMTLIVGQTGTFIATASGTAPLQYQWRRNGVALPGKTSSTITISNAQESDAGSYDVVVRNTAGSVTSSAAILTVVVTPPAIVTDPVGMLVGSGQAATFSVVASGSPPLQYQWRKNGVNIPGATDATYTTPPTTTGDHGTLFSVRVSNSSGAALSADALLQVFLARTLHGQVGTFFQTSLGEVPVPRDLRNATVELQQLDSRGRFMHFVAQGLEDGTFSVQGVPPGPFYAFIRGAGAAPTTGLWTTNETLDLRRSQVGRPDGVPATGGQAALAVNILGPVVGQISGLQLLVPTLDLVLEQAGAGPLFRFPWQGLRLVEAAKDPVWVTSLKAQTTGPDTVTKLSGALALPAFSLASSNETRKDATLVAPSATQMAQWQVNADAYANLLPGVNPAATLPLSRGPLRVDLLVQPFGADVGPIPQWPSILGFSTAAVGSLVDSGSISFGDPFPVAWGRLVRLRQEFNFDLPTPTSAEPGRVTRVSDAIQEVWPLAGWPVAARTPAFAPVQQPKVNGVDLFHPPVSVGLTPILTGSVRPQDQPSYFQVTIFLVDPSDGSLQARLEVDTEVPSLAVADGLLQVGSRYVARIVAVKSMAYDPNLPWRPTWPLITAPVYSAVLQP